jgi:hypothetical protein
MSSKTKNIGDIILYIYQISRSEPKYEMRRGIIEQYDWVCNIQTKIGFWLDVCVNHFRVDSVSYDAIVDEHNF